MQNSGSRVEESSGNKNNLEKRLEAHPELRARFERLLGVVENTAGDVEKAAEAERRVIEELRQMGSEVLHAWARRQEEKKVEEYSGKDGVNRKKKPLLADALREDRDSRAGLQLRAAWAGVAAI